MMAAAAAGAPYGTPMPFHVSFHPAYYARAAMATSFPYTAGEPVAVAEGKSKRKSSGAPSVCSASASGSSDGRSKETSEKRDASAEHKLLPSTKRRKATSANVQGEPSQNATMQDAAAETRSAAKRRSEGKLLVSTTEMTTISNARPNLNIGINLWSNSPVKAETSGQVQINAAAPSHDIPLSHMVSMGKRKGA